MLDAASQGRIHSAETAALLVKDIFMRQGIQAREVAAAEATPAAPTSPPRLTNQARNR